MTLNVTKLLPFVLATILVAACEDEHHEAGRPATFMEECAPDGGVFLESVRAGVASSVCGTGVSRSASHRSRHPLQHLIALVALQRLTQLA